MLPEGASDFLSNVYFTIWVITWDGRVTAAAAAGGGGGPVPPPVRACVGSAPPSQRLALSVILIVHLSLCCYPHAFVYLKLSKDFHH